MAITLTEANAYFNGIIHNEEWVNADDTKKQRALQNAEIQLYRIYKKYNPSDNPLPVESIFEQALWLLRIDDTVKRSEQGVTSITVSGMSLNLAQVNNSVAPQVLFILGRKVGRYV